MQNAARKEQTTEKSRLPLRVESLGTSIFAGRRRWTTPARPRPPPCASRSACGRSCPASSARAPSRPSRCRTRSTPSCSGRARRSARSCAGARAVAARRGAAALLRLRDALKLRHLPPPPSPRSYDAAYGPGASNAALYANSVAPLVARALEGFHVTVFAYGQTGSGKTFTCARRRCAARARGAAQTDPRPFPPSPPALTPRGAA